MARTFFNSGKFNEVEEELIPRFKTTLFGDWEKTIKTLNRLSPDIKSASVRAQLRVGNIIKDKVKAHMINQDLGWAPLSRKYAKAKQMAGADPRTLLAWANYYNNIKAWQVSNQHLIMIGVRAGVYTQTLKGRRSKIDIASIAFIHEFSSGRRVPRRPLWNPTIAEMGGSRGIRDLFKKHFQATMRRRGISFKDIKIF